MSAALGSARRCASSVSMARLSLSSRSSFAPCLVGVALLLLDLARLARWRRPLSRTIAAADARLRPPPS
eukprot:4410262-Pyramimonas_sp.AAC.1